VTDVTDLSFEAALAQLRDEDPAARSAAAVRLAEMWRDDAPGVPSLEALLAVLAEHDRVHPGIADAFWTTVVYAFYGERSAVRRWMLSVLEARREKRELSPVPGNDLEFYAHEEFDDDAGALRKLLDWGYVELVELALDHRALGREDMIALLSAVGALPAGRAAAQALALGYGVLVASEVGAWPERTTVDGARVRLLARDYGSQWRVTWFFPWPAPWPLGDDACLSLLDAAPEGPALDPALFTHIPFPAVPGVRERTFSPRSDTEVRVAVDAEGRVIVIRVVRSRPR